MLLLKQFSSGSSMCHHCYLKYVLSGFTYSSPSYCVKVLFLNFSMTVVRTKCHIIRLSLSYELEDAWMYS
jgi:hypothetical protein